MEGPDILTSPPFDECAALDVSSDCHGPSSLRLLWLLNC